MEKQTSAELVKQPGPLIARPMRQRPHSMRTWFLIPRLISRIYPEKTLFLSEGKYYAESIAEGREPQLSSARAATMLTVKARSGMGALGAFKMGDIELQGCGRFPRDCFGSPAIHDRFCVCNEGV